MKRPAQNTRCRRLWLLLAVFALASACTEEKELRIRTSFVELSDDEMLSGHPDRLDRYNWSVIIEYPDSIIDNRGVNHPALCDTLKNKALDVIFGPENAARARADLLPPSRLWREGENAFVRQVKALTDAFNRSNRLQYPAARDTLRGDLLFKVEVNAYLAGSWQDYVSYHIYTRKDAYGHVTMQERGFNYALDGRRIYEADLFKEGWEVFLRDKLTEAFHKGYKTCGLPLSDGSVSPNGNFKFAPGGIIWMYDEGEIAPPGYGILRVTLPWKEIQSSLSLSR